jgi:hypothetical protein
MSRDPLRDPCELWDADELDDAPDMWERVDYDYDAYTDAALNLL